MPFAQKPRFDGKAIAFEFSFAEKRERRVAEPPSRRGLVHVSAYPKSDNALRLSRLCAFALNSVLAVGSLYEMGRDVV